jgi:hypothetical protein
VNEINHGYILKHGRGILSLPWIEAESFIQQWPWRVEFERRIASVWEVLRNTPMVWLRLSKGGNTIVDNHPDLPFPSTVLYSGRTVLRSGIIPPVTKSMRITRTGGW